MTAAARYRGPAGYMDPRVTRAWRAARRNATTLTEVRVLEDLEAHERMFGMASPAVAGIAGRIGRCQRSVIRATGELEAAGRLRIVRAPVHRRDDGSYHRVMTNLYRVVLAPRNPWSHRGDMDGTPIPECIATAPRAAAVPSLFDDIPPPDPPPEPAPPPWIAEGITRNEWLAGLRRRG